MLCMMKKKKNCYFYFYSIWFPRRWYLYHYRFGCGYESPFLHKFLIENVRRLLDGYMWDMQPDNWFHVWLTDVEGVSEYVYYFFELASRYKCGLSDKAKGPWTVEVNQFMLSGTVYVDAFEKWPSKPKIWSKVVKSSKIIKQACRKHHPCIEQVSLKHNIDGCLGLAMN